MSWNQVEGKSKQYFGSLIVMWGKMVHDESTVLRGKHHQLLGIIRERYGVRRQDAEAQVDEFLRGLRSASCEQESNKG